MANSAFLCVLGMNLLHGVKRKHGEMESANGHRESPGGGVPGSALGSSPASAGYITLGQLQERHMKATGEMRGYPREVPPRERQDSELSTTSLEDRPKHRNLSKEFAQEFHESVLATTRQQAELKAQGVYTILYLKLGLVWSWDYSLFIWYHKYKVGKTVLSKELYTTWSVAAMANRGSSRESHRESQRESHRDSHKESHREVDVRYQMDDRVTPSRNPEPRPSSTCSHQSAQESQGGSSDKAARTEGSSSFKWPGIEALIESYQKHAEGKLILLLCHYNINTILRI